ncbi:hypothetical protein Tco_1492098 [Tanacetum coccineum]
MIWCGEVGGVEADSSVSNAFVSITTSSSCRPNHQYGLIIIFGYPPSMDGQQGCSVRICMVIEADPPLVPLAPHQKLTGISMARELI